MPSTGFLACVAENRRARPGCGAAAGPWSFSTAIGIASAITALPILAVIVADLGMRQTAMAAALSDNTAM